MQSKEFLLKHLDSISKRPWFYIQGTITFENAVSFFNGLKLGCFISGIEYSHKDYQKACSDRGWSYEGNEGIKRDFDRKKLSEEAMGLEYIEVEILAYRNLIERINLKT